MTPAEEIQAAFARAINWDAVDAIPDETLDQLTRSEEPPLCGCGARHWVHTDEEDR
jgi:hypothetical protein